MSSELNESILKKIDSMVISSNKKEFFKESLKMEYENRDNNEQLKQKYIQLVEKYYKK